MDTQPVTQTKSIVVTNYDKIKTLAHNQDTIQRFVDMLGSRREAQAYITSAMLAVANSKDLMGCTPSSIFNSVMRAAAMRLFCEPALRQAYLVPFNNHKTGKKDATLIIGYIGLNNIALRTGKYRYCNAGELFEGQDIEINQLTGMTRITGKRAGDKITGYFHYFELYAGYSHTLYMTVDELRAHGQRYASSNPMWQSNFLDMAKKTVTRLNLLKFGVLDPSDKANLAAMAEDKPEGEIIQSDDVIDTTFTETDDEQAASDAQVEAERKANEPKRDPAEIVGELTGEGKKKADPTTSEITTHIDPDPLRLRWPADAKITYALASKLAEKSGRRYVDITLDKMTFVRDAIHDRMAKEQTPEKRTEDLMKLDTLDVVESILKS